MSTLGQRSKNKKELETSLFERTVFSVFDQYDRQKQTDLINELIKRSKNTYFENSSREVIMRGLVDIRLQANKRKLPTSVAYLREIECRILHLIFNSSRVAEIQLGNKFIYVIGKEEDLEEYFNNMVIGEQFLYLNCNIIKNFRKMYLDVDSVMVLNIHRDNKLTQETSSTAVTPLSWVFKEEKAFNEFLESIHLPKFFFNPIYLEQSWIIFNVLYKEEDKKKYYTFKENWYWVKENAKCMIVPEPKIVCDIFFNTQYINIHELNKYNEDPAEFWSIHEGLGKVDLRNLNATLYPNLNDYARIPLVPFLIMERQTMLEYLAPVM